ncbi:MAG: hypothetical protein AAF499_03870 [Pseudomonadota bacterium]
MTKDASPTGDYPTHYRQPLTLARGAQKRLQFTVFLSRVAVPMQIRVISDGGGIVASQAIDLRNQLSRQRFVVALGRDVNLGYLNDRDTHQLSVVYPLTEFLPAHWQGYDSVEAVVLHRFSLRRLTDQQYRALQKWLATGGRLLVSGGHDTAILQAPRMAAVLPARITGKRSLSDVSALHTALESEWPLPTPSSPLTLTLLSSTSDSDTTHRLHGADNLPLVVEKAYGRGRIVVTAFDITSEPFASWRGLRDVMYRLLQLRTVQPATLRDPGDRQSAATTLLNRLTEQRSLDYPRHFPVIAFAALYLAVLMFFVRKLSTEVTENTRTYALAYVIPLMFAVAVAGLFHRMLFPQAPVLASLVLIEPIDNSTLAQLDLHIRLQSTREDPLTVNYSGVLPNFRAVANSRNNRRTQATSQPATWIFEQGPTPTIKPLDALPYRQYSAQGKDIVDFDLDVTYEAGSVLELRNRSGRVLTGLWAFTQSGAIELGTLEDGETASLKLDESRLRSQAQSDWRERLRRSHDAVSVAVFDALLNGELSSRIHRNNNTDVLLAGFTSSPWQGRKTDKRDNHYLSLMAWRARETEARP